MTFKPAHKPDGSQFTARSHPGTVPALPAVSNPFRDADGTTWELREDEYTDGHQSHVGGIQARVTTHVREEGARAEIVDARGNLPVVLKGQQHFESLDDSKPNAKAARSAAEPDGESFSRLRTRCNRCFTSPRRSELSFWPDFQFRCEPDGTP
jgi:hypothetical protein